MSALQRLFSQRHGRIAQPGEQARPRPWLSTFASVLQQAGIFGGSIIFSIILSDVPEPSSNSYFNRSQIRNFLAWAWTCWSFVLGISCLVLCLYTEQFVGVLRYENEGYWLYVGISFLCLFAVFVLNALALTAFMLMGLAASAYVGVAGWMVVGGAGTILVIVFAAFGIYFVALFLRRKERSQMHHAFIHFQGSEKSNQSIREQEVQDLPKEQ